MLRIRMARRGSTHRPFYRVVVNDSHKVPGARNVDELGYYDPTKDPKVIEIDVARADEWIRKGAVPSARVSAFLDKARKTAK